MYKENQYTLSLRLSQSEFQYVRSIKLKCVKKENLGFYTLPNDGKEAIETINSSIDKIIEADPSLTIEDFPKIVIRFVQSIEYKSDEETVGFADYTKDPYETLLEGGDCIDKSILAASILGIRKYDVVLVRAVVSEKGKEEGHVAIGIGGNFDLRGFTFNHKDNTYHYVEPSGIDLEIGEMPFDKFSLMNTYDLPRIMYKS